MSFRDVLENWKDTDEELENKLFEDWGISSDYMGDDSGNEAIDKTSEITFVENCKLLPANTPRAWPHVVNDEFFNIIDRLDTRLSLRLADGVVTVLWNYDGEDDTVLKHCIIRRDGNVVKAGMYKRVGNRIIWENRAEATISLTGAWTHVFGVAHADSKELWGDLRTHTMKDPWDGMTARAVLGQLCATMLYHEVWEKGGDAKFTVKAE
ncbi:hypothetical protein BU16DRAFT_557273 [Lophium mytilinum]|uniref:Uncharacterized protein n=1 Tax=Lophium mytilinum TaxID=390894 RepID=A0A6A6R8U7_9PEZI|nr:hypothetical protein BU16DRAFT_557273 [Lophium mytilinum]